MKAEPRSARERLNEAQEQRRKRRRRTQGNGEAPLDREQGVSLDDFLAYMPQHSYIFMPARDLWPRGPVSRASCRPIMGLERGV